MAAKKQLKPARYEVKVGVNYPPDRRAEIGDVVDDLPDYAIEGLLASGVISKVEDDG